MKNLEYYFKKAAKGKWSLGQFNFSTLDQLEGIIAAAKELKSPIILGTSEGESRFIGLKQAVALRDSFRDETGLPIFLNLDHGKSFEYIQKAIEVGYDMVHFDGSRLPLKENIQKTKEVVKYAKNYGTLVEGEVGIIGTESSKVYEGKFQINEKDFTNPKDAVEYLREAGVDCLAVSIGNMHGISTGGANPGLKTDILKDLKETCLVLHGGSGIEDKEIKRAIKEGIVKININTDLRVAFTDNLKKALEDNPKEMIPYKYLLEAIKAVQKVVEEKIKVFGSKNKI